MILDDLQNCKRYSDFHPLFKKAFDFLLHTNLAELPNGKNEIAGDELFAIVSRNGDSKNPEPKFEVHRKYLDIHFAAEGSDTIGWKYLPECKGAIGEFNTNDDYQLFNETDFLSFKLNKNKFLIVYPEDAHSPLIETTNLFKIVLKVKL